MNRKTKKSEEKRLVVDTRSTSLPKNPFVLRSPAKTCRHWSETYQRVINDEAKSCRGRAKSLSHGYNPVNFAAGPTPCPIPSKKIPCSLFCTRPRRVCRNQLLFRGLFAAGPRLPMNQRGNITAATREITQSA